MNWTRAMVIAVFYAVIATAVSTPFSWAIYGEWPSTLTITVGYLGSAAFILAIQYWEHRHLSRKKHRRR